ncbi:MAG: PQQ-binding-like beta-propeller repeat protein [Planctomycetota bacterium]
MDSFCICTALASASIVLCLATASGQDLNPVGNAGDWPTYMHDADRSGTSPVELELPLELAWSYHARKAPEPAWPPPADRDLFHGMRKLNPRVIYDRAFHVVGAGGSIFFGSSADGKVYCLDAATGREKWAFHTEGPVRLAPAVADGRALFSSDDGHAYCLDAADGALLWKLRLAPGGRRIPGNGRIISSWPARTGIVVDGGRAYACAGLFAADGVHYSVIDIAAGKKISDKKIDQSAQGYVQFRGDQLFAPTGRTDGAVIGKLARSGPPARVAKREHRPKYPYANIAAGTLQFCGGDNEIAGFELATGKKVWSAKVDGRAYSLAVAGGRLLASTSTGIIYSFANKPGRARAVKPPAPKPVSYPSDDARKRYASAADRIAKELPRRRGYCLMLNDDGARLAFELAKRTELRIVCVEPDAKRAAAARKALDEAGLCARVVVHQVSPKKLPYADYVFNLVVHGGLATGKAFDGSRAGATRVLTPCGGVAIFDLKKPDIVRRGPLKGAGNWTHFYGDAGNSTCSGDARLRGPMRIQWFGLPGPRRMVDRHNRGVAPLYAAGRLFVSGQDYIASVDAYNGTVLWELELSDSMRAMALKNCGNMTTDGGVLYVAAKNRCLAFNGDTGEVVRTFPVPAADKDWGYVASAADMLFGSATKPGASRFTLSQHSWQAAYLPLQAIVCSDSIFARDRGTGKLIWTYDSKAGAIPNPSIAIGASHVLFLESANVGTRKTPSGRVSLPALLGKGADLVALDMHTGKVVWKSPVDLAFQHALYASVAGGKLVLTGSKVTGGQIQYDLHAFDAATGKPLWKITYIPEGKLDASGGHGEITQHPVIANKKVYLWTAAYDLATGKKTKWSWRRPGGGCGTLSGSSTALFFRAGNPQMTDLATGKHTNLIHETRPGCWINVIPAGGLVLIPEGSSGCSCAYPIQASIALAPAGSQGEK